MRVRTAIAAGSVSVATLIGTATSAAAAPSDDQLVDRAVSRVAANDFTATDLAVLRTRPEFAAFPDPTQPLDPTPQVARRWEYAPVARGKSDDRTQAVDARAERCYGVDLYWRRRGLVTTAYDWHHVVQWCASRGRVNVHTRYDYVSNRGYGVYARELVQGWVSRQNQHQVTSGRQRHVEYCVVKWGCYENAYPWGNVEVDSNGYYSSRGSARG